MPVTTTKKPFPLLKLPFDVMEKVFRSMNKMDLIEVSLTSKKAVKWIKLLRIFAESYVVRHTRDMKKIQITFQDGHQIVWNFEPTVKCDMGLRTMKSVKFLFRRRFESMYCGVEGKECEGSEDQLMIQLLEHFMSIFPGFITDLHLQIYQGADTPSGFLESVTEHVGFCDNLLISGESHPWTVKYIMDNMKIGRKLEIQQALHDFHHPKIFNIPELILNQADWIKPEHLLTLKSPYAVLRHSKFTKDDMKNFLRAFLRKDTPDMAMGWWKIELSEMCTTQELGSLVPVREYKKGDRDQSFSRFADGKLEDIDCRFGADIIRNDGLLCTVIVASGFVATMHILVWHDRFPNAEHVKKHLDTIPKTVESHCQRNQKIERNLRKMHEIKKNIDKIKAENEQLVAESKKMQEERDELVKTREQFERICGLSWGEEMSEVY